MQLERGEAAVLRRVPEGAADVARDEMAVAPHLTRSQLSFFSRETIVGVRGFVTWHCEYSIASFADSFTPQIASARFGSSSQRTTLRKIFFSSCACFLLTSAMRKASTAAASIEVDEPKVPHDLVENAVQDPRLLCVSGSEFDQPGLDARRQLADPTTGRWSPRSCLVCRVPTADQYRRYWPSNRTFQVAAS